MTTLRQAIESVLSQTYHDIEYIIIDGGSTDGTVEIVREYSNRIAQFISEPDGGIYDAMNKGIALASGDIIAFLNADDLYAANDVIANVADVFLRSEADVVFGDLVYVDRLDISNVVRFYSARNFAPWKLRFGWMPPHPATFVRAEVYREAGGFDTAYRIASDYEFMVRIFHVYRRRYRWMDQILVRMRLGGISTSGLLTTLQINREIARACRKNGLYTTTPLLMLKAPWKVLEYVKRPSRSLVS